MRRGEGLGGERKGHLPAHAQSQSFGCSFPHTSPNGACLVLADRARDMQQLTCDCMTCKCLVKAEAVHLSRGVCCQVPLPSPTVKNVWTQIQKAASPACHLTLGGGQPHQVRAPWLISVARLHCGLELDTHMCMPSQPKPTPATYMCSPAHVNMQ